VPRLPSLRYLRVVRRLIQTYNLEPAGSHGVWGLDDHSFLPYIFGSAQLTQPVGPTDPMPQSGSVLRGPKPAAILKEEQVTIRRTENMYFSAVGFINDVKKGPFWEHSPILYDISGIKDGWGKINKGMVKMYNAEVLSKFPVVQHFPFGSLFSWERDPDAEAPVQTVHVASQPAGPAGSTGMPPSSMMPAPGVATGAPWASAARIPPAAVRDAALPSRQPGPEPPILTPLGRGSGPRGTTGAQVGFTKAPWSKD
jgi:serine/threonine-protein phosphatase 2A activator